MTAPSLVVPQALLERLREDTDLFSDEPDQRDRWTLACPQQPSRMTRGAKHQGEAEAGVVMPLPSDQQDIRLGQRVVPDQVAVGRVIEDGGALRVRQQGPGHEVSYRGKVAPRW